MVAGHKAIQVYVNTDRIANPHQSCQHYFTGIGVQYPTNMKSEFDKETKNIRKLQVSPVVSIVQCSGTKLFGTNWTGF
jgi:hypothetical protein